MKNVKWFELNFLCQRQSKVFALVSSIKQGLLAINMCKNYYEFQIVNRRGIRWNLLMLELKEKKMLTTIFDLFIRFNDLMHYLHLYKLYLC